LAAKRLSDGFRHRRSVAVRWWVGAAAALAGIGLASTLRAETFSVDYIVTIDAANPAVAQVRWELAGIDEIADLLLHIEPGRFDAFDGTGTITQTADQVHWVPGAPYAHLTYRVQIDHSRGRQKRYDSYASPEWIITRGRDLFPRIRLSYRPRGKERPKSRARLRFRLPAGWTSMTAHELLGADLFQLASRNSVLDRPTGWMILGKFDARRQEIAGTMVTIARPRNIGIAASEIFNLFTTTLPGLTKLFSHPQARLLIVNGPDPMWHGGISGKDSFFMHAKRPLRTPDRTSPYLHELFHVLQPYRPAADADWIEEGLAEYYSLELQRRAGLLDASEFSLGLEYFKRFGLWHVDLTTQQDNAATNNSAPLIMFAIDQRVQRATAGARRLDDVVIALARDGGVVSTESFQRVVERVAGKRFRLFFQRHVRNCEPPRFPDIGE